MLSVFLMATCYLSPIASFLLYLVPLLYVCVLPKYYRRIRMGSIKLVGPTSVPWQFQSTVCLLSSHSYQVTIKTASDRELDKLEYLCTRTSPASTYVRLILRFKRPMNSTYLETPRRMILGYVVLIPKQSYSMYAKVVSYQKFKRWEQVLPALRDAPGQIDNRRCALISYRVHRAMLVGIEFRLMFPFSELL